MMTALRLEHDLGVVFPDGNQTFYNLAGNRKVALQQVTSLLGMQRSVNLSSLVGSNASGEPVWARIMGLMITQNKEFLTIGVPDETEGGVYESIRYNADGTKGGVANSLSFGIGIDVRPMRKRMIVNGHYTSTQLPEEIDYHETVRRFIEQVTNGDYDSIPAIVTPG